MSKFDRIQNWNNKAVQARKEGDFADFYENYEKIKEKGTERTREGKLNQTYYKKIIDSLQQLESQIDENLRNLHSTVIDDQLTQLQNRSSNYTVTREGKYKYKEKGSVTRTYTKTSDQPNTDSKESNKPSNYTTARGFNNRESAWGNSLSTGLRWEVNNLANTDMLDPQGQRLVRGGGNLLDMGIKGFLAIGGIRKTASGLRDLLRAGDKEERKAAGKKLGAGIGLLGGYIAYNHVKRGKVWEKVTGEDIDNNEGTNDPTAPENVREYYHHPYNINTALGIIPFGALENFLEYDGIKITGAKREELKDYLENNTIDGINDAKKALMIKQIDSYIQNGTGDEAIKTAFEKVGITKSTIETNKTDPNKNTYVVYHTSYMTELQNQETQITNGKQPNETINERAKKIYRTDQINSLLLTDTIDKNTKDTLIEGALTLYKDNQTEVEFIEKGGKLFISSFAEETEYDRQSRKMGTVVNGTTKRFPLKLQNHKEAVWLTNQENSIKMQFKEQAIYKSPFYVNNTTGNLAYKTADSSRYNPFSRGGASAERVIDGGMLSRLSSKSPTLGGDNGLQIYSTYLNNLDIWYNEEAANFNEVAETIAANRNNISKIFYDNGKLVVEKIDNTRLSFTERRKTTNKAEALGKFVGNGVSATTQGVVDMWNGFSEESGLNQLGQNIWDGIEGRWVDQNGNTKRDLVQQKASSFLTRQKGNIADRWIDEDTGKTQIQLAGGKIVDGAERLVSDGLEGLARGLGRITVGVKKAIFTKIEYMVRGLLGRDDKDRAMVRYQQLLMSGEQALDTRYEDELTPGSTQYDEKEKEYRNQKRQLEYQRTKDVITYLRTGQPPEKVMHKVYGRIKESKHERAAGERLLYIRFCKDMIDRDFTKAGTTDKIKLNDESLFKGKVNEVLTQVYFNLFYKTAGAVSLTSYPTYKDLINRNLFGGTRDTVREAAILELIQTAATDFEPHENRGTRKPV